MVLDIFTERGLLVAEHRWGHPNECRFPLFNFLKVPTMNCIYSLYGCMLLGSLGMTLGFLFKMSCLLYVVPYWYIFILDKSRWNNHSYLYGIMVSLFFFTDADRYWSLSGTFKKEIRLNGVPFWNYFILRGQIFLVYFLAGIKKMDYDWIGGHSMNLLSTHWVFHVFHYLLSTEDIDFYIVHWGGFLLDLSGGFLLCFDTTRPFGFVFIGLFHIMNSRIFHIGMFPYVMLATMPIYSSVDWPSKLFQSVQFQISKFSQATNEISKEGIILCPKGPNAPQLPNEENENGHESVSRRHILVIVGISCHFLAQLFLPFSQFLTPGYSTWTDGLYGYSWDMMVHNWRYVHSKITVVNAENGHQEFVDPNAWTQNHRWTHHADMVKQFANCIESEMLDKLNTTEVEIYVDVWMSLNGRFAQRVYNPNINIAKAPWSVTRKPDWVLPVVHDLSNWRNQLKDIEKQSLHEQAQYEDIIFIVDFPQFALVNYIEEFNNTKVHVLNGGVAVQVLYSNWTSLEILGQGDGASIPPRLFHRISPLNLGPACYYYVFGK